MYTYCSHSPSRDEIRRHASERLAEAACMISNGAARERGEPQDWSVLLKPVDN